jgi:Xaa-Pro aminopeptidase
MSEARLARLRESISSMGLDALVVAKIENVRYLSGFTGSSAIAVVTPESAVLVTDGRYREQAGRQAASWEVVIYAVNIMDAIAGALEETRSLGLEDSSTIAFQSRLANALAEKHIEFTDAVVERLRAIKEPGEIDAIRGAVACARHAWETLLPMIQPGVSERQLAAGLDYRMMSAGADKPAFDTVVASGPNSSMPHAGITDRVLEQGDLVVIDFGALADGYCCDVTRTVCLGEPDPEALEILEAVHLAWEASFAVLAPGVAVAEADQAARDRLAESGFAEQFVHSLGHGVGLEIHEKPTLSRLSKESFEAGMVFTVEPGVYLEGSMGVRHEETVLLTEAGPEVLSRDITSAK